MATAGDEAPRSLEPVLPARQLQARRAHVLEKTEPAAGPKHAPDLAQRLLGIVDSAEHRHRHDHVERLVLERQLLGRRLYEGDLAAGLGGPRPSATEHRLR